MFINVERWTQPGVKSSFVTRPNKQPLNLVSIKFAETIRLTNSLNFDFAGKWLNCVSINLADTFNEANLEHNERFHISANF